jgi:hypothetical protein
MQLLVTRITRNKLAAAELHEKSRARIPDPPSLHRQLYAYSAAAVF